MALAAERSRLHATRTRTTGADGVASALAAELRRLQASRDELGAAIQREAVRERELIAFAAALRADLAGKEEALAAELAALNLSLVSRSNSPATGSGRMSGGRYQQPQQPALGALARDSQVRAGTPSMPWATSDAPSSREGAAPCPPLDRQAANANGSSQNGPLHTASAEHSVRTPEHRASGGRWQHGQGGGGEAADGEYYPLDDEQSPHAPVGAQAEPGSTGLTVAHRLSFDDEQPSAEQPRAAARPMRLAAAMPAQLGRESPANAGELAREAGKSLRPPPSSPHQPPSAARAPPSARARMEALAPLAPLIERMAAHARVAGIDVRDELSAYDKYRQAQRKMRERCASALRLRALLLPPHACLSPRTTLARDRIVAPRERPSPASADLLRAPLPVPPSLSADLQAWHHQL